MTAIFPPGTRQAVGRIASSPRRVALPEMRGDAVDVFLFALLGMVLTYVWRVNILWGASILAPLRLALVFTGLAALGWFLSRDPRRNIARFAKLRSWHLVLALAVIAAASVVLGGYPTRSFNFLRNVYLGVFLYLVFTAVAVRSVRDVERVMAAYVIGALLYSMRVLISFDVDRSGRLNDLISYDANDLAMLLVISIPLAVYFLRGGVRPLYRVTALFALIVFVMALVKTGSRGGFLGFLAVLLFLLLRFRALKARVRVAAITIGVATLLLAGTEAFWTQMQTLLNPTEDYNYSGASEGGRMETWKRSVGYVKQRPLGWGITNFGFAQGGSDFNRQRTAEGKGWINPAPHNSFVMVGVELGLPGLIVFVWLLAATIAALNRLGGKRGEARIRPEAALGQALIAALIAYCVSGFFLSQAYSSMLYGILGLAIGLLKVAPPIARAAPARLKLARRSVPQLARVTRS